ncbi:hypothetical protein QJQ45_025713, partial [Haematococcus lacustris]
PPDAARAAQLCPFPGPHASSPPTLRAPAGAPGPDTVGRLLTELQQEQARLQQEFSRQAALMEQLAQDASAAVQDRDRAWQEVERVRGRLQGGKGGAGQGGGRGSVEQQASSGMGGLGRQGEGGGKGLGRGVVGSGVLEESGDALDAFVVSTHLVPRDVNAIPTREGLFLFQRGPLSLSGYGPTARVPMVKSEADVSAPAEQPQMAVLMPQPLPLNEATSFVEWRHGAMGQLRLAGLWKAMVGEDTDPVRSERAYAWLLCNCKSHYLRLVVAAETAPAAWKALLADQQPDSYQLWEQLNSLQMQPGETVGQVHSRLLEIVWQLAAVKEQVSEPQQVMALLKAMPPLPQYENARDFITFGSLRSPPSLTEVKRTLQIAESRAQQAGVSAQLAAVRLRGKGGGGGGGGGGSSSSGSSSSRTQPAAVPAASSSSSTAPPRPRAAANVKCFKCGKRGHYARDCPDPARDGGMAGRGAGGEGGGASGGGAGGWAGAGNSNSGSSGLSSVTLAAVHAGTLSHVVGTAPPLPACMPAEAGVGVCGAEVHSCSAEGGSVVSCGDMTCCWSHAVGLSPMLPCVVDKHASLAPEPAAEPALLAVASTQQLDSSMRVWVADSGASHHITPERTLLHGYQGFAQPVPMGLGKSSVQLYAYGKGRVRLAVDGVRMELQDVLWAPEASTNYFSTLAAAQKGWEIRQTADTITMKSSKGELVKGRVVGRQYQLSGSAQPAVVACEPPASAQAVTAVTPQLLHERLGHLSYRAMGDMISKGMVEGVELSAGQCRAAGSGVCPGCAAGKLHRRVADTLPSLAARVAAPCDLVHTDVCGPLRIPNAAGYCFVLTFLDEHSGLSLIALLKAKSEVPAAIRDAVEWFETQGGRKVKVLRSDRGTEYVNQAVREFLSGKGIIHQQTAPYSPQQNGSAERLNRTLFEKGRCLLYSSGLSVNFWPYALRFANYVRNLSLVRGKAGTPWELFWGVRPDLSALRVFGARAYAHVPEHMRSKLGSKAVQGVFVGYELSSKAYQVLLPGGKLLITKDVVFDELDRGLPTREADLAMLLPQPEPEPGVLVPHAVHVPVEVQLPAPPAAVPAPLERAPAPPGGATSSAEAGSSSSAGAGSGAAGSGGGTEAVGRGSGAAGAAGGEGSGAANLLRQSSRLRGIQPEFAGVRSVAVAELPAEGPAIPATIKEALAGPQSEQWSLAADEEMQSLLSYGTWELVELPEGCRPLDNRWVFSVKRDGRGSIVRFKARLVVKGFLQREGIDFHELHAPVSKHATVRALLAVAAAEDMELEHLDVKTAFLNGRLEEVIYMHQPAGYEDGSGRVCRLHRALYGLRQAPRAWHARLKEELEQLGFTASAADSCLFTMMRGSSKVLLAVYVDDCLLAVSKGDMGTLEWVKQQLAAVFDIHQLGPVEQFLGMRISRDRAARQLVLSQEQYALSVVDRYGLADSRPRAVPLSTAEQLQREGVQQQSEGGHSFAEVIGSLQHLAVVSRPDIAHAVGVLAKFMSAPTKEHWRVLRGVLRYVADTAAMGLMYGASAGLVGFCDADFAGDTDTRRSTTGHVFMLHGGAVSWSSRRQPTVAASTTESEYMACSAAGKEGLWLRGVLADLSLGSAVVQPVTIMCDNEAALTLVKHPIASARSKHIDVLHHFVRERVARGELVFKFCGSAANVADVFTKALPSVKFEFCKAARASFSFRLATPLEASWAAEREPLIIHHPPAASRPRASQLPPEAKELFDSLDQLLCQQDTQAGAHGSGHMSGQEPGARRAHPLPDHPARQHHAPHLLQPDGRQAGSRPPPRLWPPPASNIPRPPGMGVGGAARGISAPDSPLSPPGGGRGGQQPPMREWGRAGRPGPQPWPSEDAGWADGNQERGARGQQPGGQWGAGRGAARLPPPSPPILRGDHLLSPTRKAKGARVLQAGSGGSPVPVVGLQQGQGPEQQQVALGGSLQLEMWGWGRDKGQGKGTGLGKGKRTYLARGLS